MPDGDELAVLRMWPSKRVAVGVHLQTAIGLGAQAPDMTTLLASFLARAGQSWSRSEETLGREISQPIGRAIARYWGEVTEPHIDPAIRAPLGLNIIRDIVHDIGFYLVQNIVRYFDRNIDYPTRYLDWRIGLPLLRDINQYLGWNIDRHPPRGFVRHFIKNTISESGQYVARDIIRAIGLGLGSSGSQFTATWWPAFLALEIGSAAGRCAPRAVLAHSRIPVGVPLLALFRSACQASFAPGDATLRAAAVSACDAFEGDPLWPALARHIARISTEADRTLLEDLARYPGQREPPLSWGLQHFVRGDLVFDDGSVVTLDDLCAQVGLAPLPMLEPMPDELDLKLDDSRP
jgi:hypothetical protein